MLADVVADDKDGDEQDEDDRHVEEESTGGICLVVLQQIGTIVDIEHGRQ